MSGFFDPGQGMFDENVRFYRTVFIPTPRIGGVAQLD